jgi:DEAD/DEAH box helicase domain-containing protein
MNTQLLAGRKIAVFDAEIKKRIEDCSRGWKSHDEMGISVLCLYDYVTGRYRVFDDKNAASALAILSTYDLVVGFNTVGFDWKLVNATWGKVDNRRSKDFDILREIWIALGLDPDHFDPATHGGYKLDDVARETIQMTKTANGAAAPIMFQNGEWADLVDYCLEDVRIERTLFEFVVSHGFVVRNGRIIQIPFSLSQ